MTQEKYQAKATAFALVLELTEAGGVGGAISIAGATQPSLRAIHMTKLRSKFSKKTQSLLKEMLKSSRVTQIIFTESALVTTACSTALVKLGSNFSVSASETNAPMN